jgi:hypothetical protein
MFTFSHPRPSQAVARAVWLWGARIVFALWAVTALVFLAAGELPAAGQAKLAGLFGLLLAGWTGGWLDTRRRPPVPAAQ